MGQKDLAAKQFERCPEVYDEEEIYPVITLVLYWGNVVWNADSDLY